MISDNDLGNSSAGYMRRGTQFLHITPVEGLLLVVLQAMGK